MNKLGKKRTASMKSIEAYASCYPSTKCDSDFLCACNCKHSQSSASMAPPQTTNCKTETNTYAVNYLRTNGKSLYYSSCIRK